MMLLWVVMAVAVRRWQSLLAVAVGRRVCLHARWGVKPGEPWRGSALESGGSWHPAHLVLIRRRCSLTVTAARLMRGGLRRHVRSGRARPGHETGCMDSCVCSCITTVRCGAASQTGSLGRVGRAPRLAEGALLSTRQPWAAVRGAPATIVVVVAWPLVVAAVEGRPARVRAVGVGGLLLVRGPLMWYLLVGGLRRRRRRRRLRCSPRAAGLGRVLPALLSSVLVALRVLGQILGLGGVRRLPKVVVVQRLLSGDPLRRVHRQQRRQQLLRLLVQPG